MARAESQRISFDSAALGGLLDGDLVDAFGIPDEVLGAPIGLRESA